MLFLFIPLARKLWGLIKTSIDGGLLLFLLLRIRMRSSSAIQINAESKRADFSSKHACKRASFSEKHASKRVQFQKSMLSL